MRSLNLLVPLAISVLFIGCVKLPYKAASKSHKKQLKELQKKLALPRIITFSDSVQTKEIEVIETVNFNLRKPSMVVIHHTAQDSCAQTFKTFTLKRTQVSSHYVICKDGTIVQMLSDYLRGWHAGRGRWSNITDVNSVSVGIELDNNGFEPFPDQQIKSLLLLLNKLKTNYKIPAANFIGHSDMAPSRKVDPNAYFPWQQLAMKGYGIWYDNLEEVPEWFTTEMGLQFIGYDTANLSAAIQAFELHFSEEEINGELSDKEMEILYSLYISSME